METVYIAESFIDLALKYDWGKVRELSVDEVQILLATVSAAGFETIRVTPGKLVGNCLEQDCSRTGETYQINSYCPYKVISRDGHDHYPATGWLDCALRLARRRWDREQVIEAIRHEIERSIPLKPIQLTPEGDLLQEYPPSYHGNGYFVDHTKDDHQLSYCVGVHDYCNSFVDRTHATKTYDALICRSCHLRVLFLKEIDTYGELRKNLESKFAQAPA